MPEKELPFELTMRGKHVFSPVVRTLVPTALRTTVEFAVRRALALWTMASTAGRSSHAPVHHAEDFPSLYVNLEYNSRPSTLLMHVEQYDAVRMTAGARWRGMRLSEIASGWDCGVLIFSEHHARRIGRVMRGPVGARFGVVASSVQSRGLMLDDSLVSILLGRWLHADTSTVAVASSFPHLREFMLKLKPRQRLVLLQVFRDPSAWTVKAMAAASSGERRTLERAYADAGLPSPAKVLLWARRQAATRLPKVIREGRCDP